MSKTKNKVYVVETAPEEFKTFDNWPACQRFVQGKPFAFAGGPDRSAALAKLAATRGAQMGYARKKAAAPAANPATAGHRPADYPTAGLTSDAGTHGNPGPCEYQVTDIGGRLLEHRKLGVHTNNYAELAGILAMVRLAIKTGETLLWTDSTIAMGWIRTCRLGPSVAEPERILEFTREISRLLAQNPQLQLRKWETRRWGQIPSDFGRK